MPGLKEQAVGGVERASPPCSCAIKFQAVLVSIHKRVNGYHICRCHPVTSEFWYLGTSEWEESGERSVLANDNNASSLSVDAAAIKHPSLPCVNFFEGWGFVRMISGLSETTTLKKWDTQRERHTVFSLLIISHSLSHTSSRWKEDFVCRDSKIIYSVVWKKNFFFISSYRICHLS